MEFNVKRLLTERGMSQKDLAEKLDVKPESLSRALNGNPTVRTLNEIAIALNVDVSRLFASKHPYGFIEHDGELHRITSTDDIKSILNLIEKG